MLLNNLEIPDPDSVTWRSPEVIVRTIDDEPVLGATWQCTVSYDSPSLDVFGSWYRLLGSRVEVELPAPVPGARCPVLVSGVVESVEPRYHIVSGNVTVIGIDIVISAIVIKTAESGR